ncbi:ATP-binding protein [Mucilaginibacter sp. KACC 22773]|uniref:ATP-binding protein n=1 Tax=Mucilaginibacter sp. KACC 22773 TaxID=3025671 RepID=UPI00236717AE|nr:ATP-binding protein [Mucilaginibacter sp. KACC 22773]WDF78796.1 ATP-binding protein [Mucilaginibacter sp. KACC 22773]
MFLNKPLWRTLLWCMLLCAANGAYGQDTVVIRGSSFGTLHEVSLRDSLWFFHAGELPQGKLSLNSTNGWNALHYTAFGKSDPPPGWQGLGWFGLWLKVDTNLVGKKLSFRINHDGASEIFIDGKQVGGYGKVGHSAQQMEAIRAPRDLIPLWFNDTRPHLITMHYSNYFGVYANFLGFEALIGDYEPFSKHITHSRQLFSFVPMCAAAEIILGVLHFLLFLFYPRQKLNLYYALFVLLVGINSICIYLFYFTSFPLVQYYADFLTQECKVLMMWGAVMLLYVLDYGRVPRWRVVALTGVNMLYFIGYFLNYFILRANVHDDYFSVVFFVCIMDGFWSAFHLIKKKQRGVWLIATGVVAVVLVYFFAWADVFHLWTYELNSVRVFVMSIGQLILPLCLSLYLALDFARTNQNLAAKLAEVEKLSAQALAQETEKRERIAAEAKRLEEIVQQRTAELSEKADKLREMDVVKSRFFTNITHEFKTPLTLIINPANELLSVATGTDATKYIRLILSNAARLLRLINQLLDLSKLESGLMEVSREPLDFVALIRMHIHSYESLVVQKGIRLHFASDWDKLWISGDRDKLDKIILNILSNAIKFTDNGRVEVLLQKDTGAPGNVLSITVRDTGRGIPASKLPYIFSRFYQADPSDTRSAEGTGIGLAVAKELVELMGGQIRAESMEGLFTEINIRMPYEVAEAGGSPLAETVYSEALYSTNADDSALPVVDTDKPLVLLIEDHDELREFMQQSLTGKYRVISAADGDAGIALALEHIPNLVITDLMMPRKDGYQVSATLKKDEKTSHIPIIILTAKADMDSKVQGIETGADAYLGKPFDKRELFALIENLINVRNQLREHYSSRDLWFSDVLSMPSIEQDFIARVRNAVESHLDEEGYSADQLARDIGLSRTQLHRKLKGLIGQAPGELIRIIRLQYAHNLLQRRVATVSEVAYMVGFSSPASFSASFSRHFGFAPKTVGVM